MHVINLIRTPCIFLSATLLFVSSSLSQQTKNKISSTPYTWRSVQIAGGGFVDGIIFHPTAKGVRYCRTDMGGAYRWNDTIKRWEPMLDFISYDDYNLMGVESIAVDPNDPDFVILACGTYTSARVGNGAILRSFDRGKTFERIAFPFKFGGNENGRGNGERMAVDPLNGNIIYLGTRLNGLWKSIDKGKTWQQVKTFPDIKGALPTIPVSDSLQRRRSMYQNRGSGIAVTLFDTWNSLSKEFSVVYTFASLLGRDNIFKSNDGGKTWLALAGQPIQYRPTHAVLAANGNLYVTYGDTPGPTPMINGAVWKYNTNTGKWLDITPDKPNALINRKFGYAAVAVDAQNAETLIVSTYNRYKAGGEEIFRSLNGGLSWKPVFKTGKIFNDAAAPYVERAGIHWLFDIEIDPLDSNHAMFTTGYGGHETFNLTDVDKGRPTTWTVMNKGIEETVALEMVSPTKGASLITAIGDYGGFVHWNLDKPVKEGNFINPHFNNTDGVSCAENNPDIIVRVGIASHPEKENNIGYSLNGGKSWQPTSTMPQTNSQHGSIAVSANGKTWIWTPQSNGVYITNDKGNSWKKALGIPSKTRVIADKVNTDNFYGVSLSERKLYFSKDGGNTFTGKDLPANIQIIKDGVSRGDIRGCQDRIYAAPGQKGDLWLALFDGLYHSPNGGNTFSVIKQVTLIHGFGFGKAAPGTHYSSLYLLGVVNEIAGIFRSDDIGQKWIRINDDAHQWGLILQITGDPKKYGRVYVGTHGRGIFYGDPGK